MIRSPSIVTVNAMARKLTRSISQRSLSPGWTREHSQDRRRCSRASPTAALRRLAWTRRWPQPPTTQRQPPVCWSLGRTSWKSVSDCGLEPCVRGGKYLKSCSPMVFKSCSPMVVLAFLQIQCRMKYDRKNAQIHSLIYTHTLERRKLRNPLEG